MAPWMLHCMVALIAALTFLFNASLVESLAPKQIEGLLKLQKMLETPSATSSWSNNTNFCSLPQAATLNLTCAGETLTYLRIVGDKIAVSAKEKQNGQHSLSEAQLGGNKSLSSAFSINALVDTMIASFPDLQGVELVAVGMWGTVPATLGLMKSLTILNASSNLLTGNVPREFTNLTGIKTLALDNNAISGPFPYFLSSVPSMDTLFLNDNFLSGAFNDSISYFWNLKVLSLSNNLLTGSIPSSMTSLQNLQVLSLAHNRLAGMIPNLETLTNLTSLNIGGNSFGPGFPSLGVQMVTLQIGQNSFTGSIPSSMKNFEALKNLDVSGNAFVGMMPFYLFALPRISSLNLARNRFSGTLPSNFTLGKSLSYVDVSGNFLYGKVPVAFLSPGKNVNLNYQGNCMSSSNQKQGTQYYCTVTAAKLGIISLHHNHLLAIIAAAVGGGAGVTVALCAFVFVLIKKSCGSDKDSIDGREDHSFANSLGIPSELLFNARYISQSMRLGVLPQSVNRTFTIEDLKTATNNFSSSSFVGEGRHGKVFKGQLEDKTYVAVKWLAFKSKEDMNEYKTQAEVLSKLRHRHLVSVLGYCTEEMSTKVGDEEHKSYCLFIVSDFVEQGDLRSHLRRHKGRDALNWSQRLAAVIGAGRGIHYLHTGVSPPIFYNNLKITNILLDSNMVAQVSDFGLPVRRVSFSMDVVAAESKSGSGKIGAARLVHDASLRSWKWMSKYYHVFARPEMRTDIEEELDRREQRDKQDVYDYGAMLLEMVLGRPPTIRNPFPQKRSELERLTKEKGPSMELIDKSIVGTCGAESLATVLEIAGKCMVDDPMRRPSMEDVLWNLQYAVQVHSSTEDSQDENDRRREEFQKAPTSSAEKKRNGFYDNRVADEDWKAGPSASRDFLR